MFQSLSLSSAGLLCMLFCISTSYVHVCVFIWVGICYCHLLTFINIAISCRSLCTCVCMYICLMETTTGSNTIFDPISAGFPLFPRNVGSLHVTDINNLKTPRCLVADFKGNLWRISCIPQPPFYVQCCKQDSLGDSYISTLHCIRSVTADKSLTVLLLQTPVYWLRN